MALRVVAVAAPELPERALGTGVLKSQDPASLFNACRYAAFLAENKIGPWGESNWSLPRKERRESVLLMHSLKEDISLFADLLERIQPNLLLIGAMSLCLPGAIECARIAKKMLGNHICVVLGGRHATETIYLNQAGTITHHPGSPLRLMAEGLIPMVFDLVVSGEGEHIIATLGEIIDDLDKRGIEVSTIAPHLHGATQTPGRWITGWVQNGTVRAFEGKGANIDRNNLPSPCEMFGIKTSFDVFGGRLTAHAFSDTGNGCAFDCPFCSERRSATGPLLQLETSADRLFRQLQSAVQVVLEDSSTFKASAFVEDSTMLAGSNTALRELVRRLSEAKLDLRFGAQFTTDQLLSRKEILLDLKTVGLDYLFVGVETPDPTLVGGMSKDVKSKEGTWIHRNEQAFKILTSLGIQCGAALLFGLGETHKSRLALLRTMEEWRTRYGSPKPLSINWAVQHPLRGEDGGTAYRYQAWGTPPGAWLDAFQDFGEASLLYPLAGTNPPLLGEVREIADFYRELFNSR